MCAIDFNSEMIEEYVITIPNKLNVSGICYLDKQCISLPNAARYFFDFKNTTRAFPFGILTSARMIDQIKKRLITRMIDRYGITPEFYVRHSDGSTTGYLKHIGYFDSFACGLGKSMGEAHGGDSYVPVTKLNFSEIINEASGTHYGDTIQKEAERLSRILIESGDHHVTDDDSGTENYSFLSFSYIMREIMRNSFEHSMSEDVYICGQYFKTIGIAEIAILDEGIGIVESLRGKYTIKNPAHALSLALTPGISGVDESSLKDNDWDNSGFGLYIAKRICEIDDESQFCIASSGCIKTISKEHVSTKSMANFHGTAVMIKLKISGDIYFENLLERVVKEGEAIAEKLGGIKKASTASKRASLRAKMPPPSSLPNPPDGGDVAD